MSVVSANDRVRRDYILVVTFNLASMPFARVVTSTEWCARSSCSVSLGWDMVHQGVLVVVSRFPWHGVFSFHRLVLSQLPLAEDCYDNLVRVALRVAGGLVRRWVNRGRPSGRPLVSVGIGQRIRVHSPRWSPVRSTLLLLAAARMT